MKKETVIVFAAFLFLFLPLTKVLSLEVASLSSHEQIDYALSRLTDDLDAINESMTLTNNRTETSDLVITVEENLADSISSERFLVRHEEGVTSILASTPRGAMYGILQYAETLRQGSSPESLQSPSNEPALPFRAIKFNLPFMSYRTGEALQSNYETCRDLSFWEGFLDMMADNHFNVLTLWSLHPFHYMVKPKDFPEASPWSNTEMEEWRTLWKGIFAMAKERGIDTYLINWNTFVSPEFARAHGIAEWSETWQHYGSKIDDQSSGENELIQRYTRQVVTQVIDEYPNLSGLGITLGEFMGSMDADTRRNWLDNTFFSGIEDASRKIKFLYRAPLSANKSSSPSTSEENDRKTRAQIEGLKNIIDTTYISFKYNWSHGHSSPDLFMVHGGKLSDAYWNPEPETANIIWTVRNEDFHILRWAQPDFIRQHLASAVKPYIGGYIVGSEIHIPAFDNVTALGPHKTWKWQFERQWLLWKCWGRLLYDDSTPDQIFENELAHRFGQNVAKPLLQAWKLASKTPLTFASFYRGQNDLSLYTEGHVTWDEHVPPAFISVDRLINRPVLDSKRYINIKDWTHGGEQTSKTQSSPLQLADQLYADATKSMLLIDEIKRANTTTPTLDAEMADIESWYWYAKYSADQIRGGIELERYRLSGDKAKQRESIRHLRKASTHWRMLSNTIRRYNKEETPFYAGVPFSWIDFLPETVKDIQTASQATPYKQEQTAD